MSKGPILAIVLGALAFFAWKSGIIGPGGTDIGSATSGVDTGGAVSALEPYKYPAIATAIICTVLFFFWKNTPAVVKYPLVTVLALGWLYFSAK